MMERGETRLLIDIGELRDYDAALAQNVLDNPAAWLPSFDKSLIEKVANLNPEYGKENKVPARLAFRRWLKCREIVNVKLIFCARPGALLDRV